MRELDQLAYPVLDIPVFQHTSIFRAVEQVLKTDPIFPRACNAFLSWTGSSDDTKEPALSYCPYCRISPGPMTAFMATERQHSAPMAITTEIATVGTNVDNLMNFWGLIWGAIFNMSDMVRFGQVTTMLQAAGVTRPVMTMQGFGIQVDNTNNYMLVGQGSIVFNTLLPK